MDEHEAREFLTHYTPEQIRLVAARLGQQALFAAPNVREGVRLLTAVAVVYLSDKGEANERA